MKIKLVLIGKTENNFSRTQISEYSKRINHYVSFEIKEINYLKNTKNLSAEQQKIKEGDLMLGSFSSKDYVILLDEKGKEFTSVEFSGFIENKIIIGSKNIIFVIGGGYGFSENVYKRADIQVSLSKLTFPHQLVRVIFLEQLYRAFTIIKGEPYHHV